MSITEKRCARCKLIKAVSEFHVDRSMKDGFKSWCKVCVREEYLLNREKRYETSKRWKSANKSKCNEYNLSSKSRKFNFIDSLKTSCRKCGESRLYVIEFHHVEPKTKCFNISGSTKKRESILDESKKCICLCSNCHKEFHHFYGKNPENPTEMLEKYLGGIYSV